MKIYEVVSEFYDNGKVDVMFYRLELDVKPDNKFEERKHCDVYCDYFTNEKEATKFYNDCKKA